MRFVLLLSAVSLGIAAASLACAKAPPPAADSSQDSTEAKDNNSSTPAPATAAPAPAAPAATDPDAGDGGAVLGDGGLVVVGPTGPVTTTPSALCLPGSIPETEPNNDATTANSIPAVTSTFCGHLDPGDVDFVTFIMPQQVFSFGFGVDQANGFINVQPFAGGQPFDFNDGNAPFLAGQPYTFQITAGSNRAIDYRLSFQFQ
jgi:hypothetical protein